MMAQIYYYYLMAVAESAGYVRVCVSGVCVGGEIDFFIHISHQIRISCACIF